MKRVHITSGGRVIKTPKHLLTDSNEFYTKKRKSQKETTLAKEKQKLTEQRLPENSVLDIDVKPNATLNSSNSALERNTSKTTEYLSNEITSSHLNGAAFKSNLLHHGRINTDPLAVSTITIDDDNFNADSNVRTNIAGPSNISVSEHSPMYTEHLELSNLETPLFLKMDNSFINHFGQMLQKINKIEEQNDKIIKQNEDLKQQIALIIEDLSERNVSEASLSENLFEPLKGYPLQSIEQFNELNSNYTLRKQLFNHLVRRGGTKLREFLNCSLKQTMTDNLVSLFTWLGDKNHPKFGDTKVANVIYLAAKKCPFFTGPQDKNEFKNEMIEVLRTTKQRFRNCLKKCQPKNQTKTNDDEVKVKKEQDRINVQGLNANEILAEIEGLIKIQNLSGSEDNFDEEDDNSDF